jgi:hypothetical protein
VTSRGDRGRFGMGDARRSGEDMERSRGDTGKSEIEYPRDIQEVQE